jgi:uncharacterized membrane protein YgdD (TMEM256/DUF423 family)
MGRWLALAGLSGLIAVAIGAFGAHILAPRIGATGMSYLTTGTGYQLFHSAALLAVAALMREPTGRSAALELAAWCFLAGIVLFCGSLYLLALTGASAVVWATPIGGVAFMVGWAALARHGFQLWRAS